MECQKIIILLDNTPNRPTEFRTKNWVEINDKSCGTYNTNSQNKFETSVLRSSLCDYTHEYMLVSGTITVPNTTASGTDQNNAKNIIIKNCALFINSISKMNNTQIDSAKDIYIVMPMYNLLEYRDNYSYSKTSAILW